MAEPRQDGLTDDQAAVYDRQLRVWGVEVQKKWGRGLVLLRAGGDQCVVGVGARPPSKSPNSPQLLPLCVFAG